MQPNKTITGSSAPSKPVLGQVIACVLALGVMGVGAWSLLGQASPYHPDSYEGAVPLGLSDLTGFSESN